MRRNKLITLTFVSVLSLALAACGGDDDDGGGTVDAAAATIDAPVNNTPDAMSTTQLTEGLGAQCADPSECTDVATDQCLGAQGAPNGNCTLGCGTTQSNMEFPAGGDTMCQNAYKGATGTPACYITTSSAAPFNWFCGVLCGNAQGTDFGACPAPLNCVLRQGQTFGDCN